MARSFRGYDISDEIIGMGGMAVIYAGVQRTLKRKVAIKILQSAFSASSHFISRFEREARAAASLHHPNIISIIDYGEEDDAYYIVMEFVQGSDLRKVMDEQQPIPIEVSLIMLDMIATGLDAAHGTGIVHRDMKPSNVLISKEGEVKITDFGLAREQKDRERIAAADRTVAGSVMGTIAYMSPEQHEAREDIDHRTDYFALGVLAYELLAGRKPFEGSTTEVRDGILTAVPPRLNERCPLATPEIESLVHRLLEKNRDKRHKSGAEVLRDVRAALEDFDPSGESMKFKREHVRDFLQDPVTFRKALRDRRIESHILRALDFINGGPNELARAERGLKLVLSEDPNNRTAKETLEIIRQKRKGTGVEGNTQVRIPKSREKSIYESAPYAPRTKPKSKTKMLALPSKLMKKPKVSVPRAKVWAPAVGLFVAAAIFFSLRPVFSKPSTEVGIDSMPRGATVEARQAGKAWRQLGLTPFSERLRPGAWEIAFRRDGFVDTTLTVSLAEDEPAKVNVSLRSEVAAAVRDGGSPPPVAPPPKEDVVEPPKEDENLVADEIAPAGIEDLRMTATTATSVSLAWTAPTDEGPDGKAARYDLRWAKGPEDDFDFDSARTVSSAPKPKAAGGSETYSAKKLEAETEYTFGIRSADAAGNWSDMAVVSAKTQAAPAAVASAIRVTVNPKANVLVDGKVIERDVSGTVIVPVSAGQHELELQHEREAEVFDLRADGDTVQVAYDFKVRQELKVVTGRNYASVEIDGRLMDGSTPSTIQVRPGIRSIRVVREGFRVTSVQVLEDDKEIKPISVGKDFLVRLRVTKGKKPTIKYELEKAS